MNLRPLAALLAAAPLLATAAEASHPAPAGPKPVYRSVLPLTPGGVEEGSVAWRQANADVARFPRGHADLLKWEEAQQAAPAPGGEPPRPAPAHQHQEPR